MINSKGFHLLTTHAAAFALFFALGACSGGGGNFQQLDAAAPSLDTPVSAQNQMGPPARPPVAAEIDPQEGIDLAELRASCQSFLDADNKAGSPQKCQDYWDFLKNDYSAGSGRICIVGRTCPQGQIYTVEPQAETVTQPVVQHIKITNQEGIATTYQLIPTSERNVPEGFLLNRTDSDDD